MDHPRPDWSRYRKMLLMSLHRARIAVVEQLTDIRLFLVSLRTPEGLRASWQAARPLVVFAVAYVVAWSYLFIAAFLGAKPPPAPLFAPGAVLLCALLLMPPRRWWLYLLVAFVIQVPILAYLHLPLWWNLVGFIPDAVEPVLAVLLLRRYLTPPPRFASLREASVYTACGTVAVAVAATIGSGVNAVIGGESYWIAWRTWFLGDTLTALILAPTILLWVTIGARGLHADSRWRYTEVILVYGGLLVIGVAAFDTRFFAGGIAGAAIYLPAPLLLWAAVRFGPRGLVSGLSLIVALAIPAVANALGPFASLSVPAPSVLDQVFQLQLFLLVIGVPLFLLAALIQERQRTETSLQTSEARYRAAFESAVTGMMLLSAEGHPLRVNRPLVEMLGYAEDELRSKTLADITYPDDLELNLAMFRQAVTGEISSYRLDTRFFDKQGHIVWGILSAGVVRDIAGKPLYLVGQIENITERKLLEREREEARDQAERQAEELDRVFEAMADGIAVFDQDGRHLRFNTAYQRLLGLDTASSDYAEHPLHERLALLAIRDEQGHPLAAEETPLARALNGEILAEERALDLRVRTLDGREIELRVSAAPIRAPTGQLVGAVSVYRDVTEHQKLEHTLAEQAEQLNRIFEGIADGLVVYDAAGQVLRTNATARRILGLDAAPTDYAQVSTHGRAILYEAYDDEGQRLAPEDWPLIRVLRGLVADADARDVRLRVLDGREVDLHTSAAPLRDGAGRLVGAVSILHDQTERRRLEREREEVRARELAVREVNQRLDIFVTMAAHDLRSPVAVSRMVVQMARAKLERAAAGGDPEHGADSALTPALDRAAEALATTADNLDRLWRLEQQLLDVARVKEGMLILNLATTDLAELLRACVAEQCMLNPSRLIELDLPASADVSSVIVDADVNRLNQVITNYLSNAERYSPEDQPITVALRLVDGEVSDVADAPADGVRERRMRPVARVEVCDHGVGIAEEDQVTIWDRFQRAASVDQASGLGLGLYIVRTIVELHGGRVGVQSISGHGSTFWFTIPLLAGPAITSSSDDLSDDQNMAP
ncbi:MAG TPA: PAS domain S-box protein [Ktedonobacterales bacterium]|nr:PAS domain S-box protein [Ktedonobacterales bacterium]